MQAFTIGEILYSNPLADPADVVDWVMEGDGAVSFPKGRMRQESRQPREAGQKGNIVHWCPETFPDNIAVAWDFQPLTEPGLAILFFSALGLHGEDIFTGGLAPRSGPYNQYNNGDLNVLHVSYFRRNTWEHEFQTCNLRKSKGFHLVAQGADPLPTVGYIKTPYRLELIKAGPFVRFTMRHAEETVEIFRWEDDGETWGPVLGKGKIGFRQMTPLIAEYGNFEVRRVNGI